MKQVLLLLLLLGLTVVGSGDALSGPSLSRAKSILANAEKDDVISRRLDRFTAAPVGVKVGVLPKQQLAVIGKLVQAADAIDTIFWRQVFAEGLSWYKELQALGTDRAKRLAALMGVHYGPWDRLDNAKEFVGTRSKPAGAGFYPSDVSRHELEVYLSEQPEKYADLMGPYSVVRRKGSGFVAIPYSRIYKEELAEASAALRAAADLCRDKKLKAFFKARADAFESNEYLASEMLWMDTRDSPLIVVIGPYEFYEDKLLGAKASFEAILAWRNDKETKRFASLSERLGEFLAELPLDAARKERLTTVKQGPLTIAEEIYAAGETRAGAQTTAFSLPNDMRVRREKGTRQVILRNIASAKFYNSWQPLSRLVVAEDQLVHLDFDSYYAQLLATQLANAIVPAKGGKDIVRTLKERRQVIQETKSDAMGLLLLIHMAEKGWIENLSDMSAGVTHLASSFRVIRFGTGGAHGLAKAITFNYLVREGAYIYDPTTRRYGVVIKKLKPAVIKLNSLLVDILTKGQYDVAGRLIMDFGLLSGDVRAKLSELDKVPVDIRPEYSIKKMLK